MCKKNDHKFMLFLLLQIHIILLLLQSKVSIERIASTLTQERPGGELSICITFPIIDFGTYYSSGKNFVRELSYLFLPQDGIINIFLNKWNFTKFLYVWDSGAQGRYGGSYCNAPYAWDSRALPCSMYVYVCNNIRVERRA